MYDLIVVGAGPAGSTAAREAAASGASVLLLDRAVFPRDKPCGGGVNVRAARQLPFSLVPVTERTIRGIGVSLDRSHNFTRRSEQPLCYMTQRSRLDAYLVEQAVRASVSFHDGAGVRSVDLDGRAPVVRTNSQAFSGRLVIGADGANGIVARGSGLAGRRRLAVAFEADYPWHTRGDERWRETIAMDLGLIPGGYGWLFPKGDHVNIGVGGWRHFGPTLRGRLDRLARFYGRSPGEARNLRGHHLPIRTANAPLARGRVMLVGDAAGLIDPLSGEGIYAAIYSGGLAASYALQRLSGQLPDLSGYQHAIDASLGRDLLASQRFQDVFHLMPRVYVEMLHHSDRLWEILCGLVRGEQTYLDLRRRIGPLAGLVDLLSLLAHRTRLGTRAGLRARAA